MSRRPRSVTAIGWLFVGAGIVGFVSHATDFNTLDPFAYELVWILTLRILAIVAGSFMLRGGDWARWLALTWMAYHVVLSAFHSLNDTLIHAALFAVIAFVLLRPAASAYFRPVKRQLERPAAQPWS